MDLIRVQAQAAQATAAARLNQQAHTGKNEKDGSICRQFYRGRLVKNVRGWSVLAVSLLAGVGCAHRELTAPCSDYKAASFTPAARPSIPCDTPLQMQRPTLD